MKPVEDQPAPSLHPENLPERFIQILEATTDVVAMSDLQGRLLYLNTAGRNLFGWDDDESVGQHELNELYPAWAYQVVLHDAMPAARREGSWSGETALAAPGDREVPILQVVLAHNGPDGNVEFFSTICRDISDRKQKELERIEWANRYDAAIRASGQVLFDWDSASGDITYGGDLKRLLGYTAEEMSGGLDRLREVIHPNDLEAFDAEIERVQTNRDPFHHEFHVRKKTGETVMVEAQGFFFLDRQGRIGRMVGFLRNVTVERTAERAVQVANERLEQRVAERTAAIELSARRQEAVARLGQRALAGLPLEQLMQEAVEISHHGLQAELASVLDYDAQHDAFVVRAEIGWPTPGVPNHIPGGTASQSGYAMLTGASVVSPNLGQEHRFVVSEVVRLAGAQSGMSACIQAGDRPLGVVNVFHKTPRDYTPDDVNFLQAVANVLTAAIERHRVEADLRRTRAEAEAANRAKSEFLSRMSHELRTPLNAILGFSQLLEIEEHNERQAESIAHISRAGQNLLNLINEVLDIARLDAGRMQFRSEPVELPALLREVMMLTTAMAARNQVTLKMQEETTLEPPCVSLDRERLKQVLLNLVSNAVKYNRPQGKVTMTIARTEANWRINIADTGRGIPADQLPRLFKPFERLGQKEGGTEDGTGLGLALAQRLVTALNGKLGVTSTVNVGSTFWVEVPALDGAPPSIPLKPNPQSSSRSVAQSLPTPTPLPSALRKERVVLYIEDDIANYYLLERILQSRKELKLVSALQGSLGLELARSQQPDLILLDLNLPDMSGEQLLRKLKGDPQTASIPVIAVTGEAASNRPDQLRAIGAVETLVKPYRVQELTVLIDRALKGA
jgi:PAS domain S-box-containing protein